jgi:hypothetical protein
MGSVEPRASELGRLDHASSLHALRLNLERWEAVAGGDPLEAHCRGVLGEYLVGLRALTGTEPDRRRAVLLAALALGPRGSTPPDAGDLDPLLEAAVETSADAVDLAIAWGCGWRRAATADHEWHGRWVAALLSLSWLVAASINRTMRWLEGQVSGVRESLRELGAEDRVERIHSHAQHIALELAFGRCRCGHGGGEPGGPCGRSDHQLTTWRPETCHLRAFIATAVRGTPGMPPRAGGLAVSMLAEPLSEDRIVRVDVAEFHVCHVCNADAVRLAPTVGGLDLGSVSRGLHDLSRCPACGVPPHPGRTYRVARKNWLVVPGEWGGRYDPVRRHRCACCGNLFAANRDRCPLCRHRVPARHRLTSVWVRRVGLDVRRSGARGDAGRA